MKKKNLVVLFVILLVASVHVYAAMSDAVVIDSKTGGMTPVTFTHTAHLTKLAGKCVDCHATAAGGTIKFGPQNGATNDYHKVCVECHKAAAKGPTGCKDCHK